LRKVRYAQLDGKPREARQLHAQEGSRAALVVAGTVAGTVGVVSLALAVVGVIGATLPVLALIVAALCAVGFLRTVGSR
jgi:hypothetical protein